MLRHTLLFALLAYVTGPAITAETNSATYTGRLVPVQVADKNAAAKGFRVTWFLPAIQDPKTEAMFVAHEDLHALPWFLRAGFAPPQGPGSPRVGYQLDGRSQLVELPPLVIQDLPEEQADDAPADESTETINGRECRLFEGQLPSGRYAKLAIDAETGQLVRYSGTIVIGRGDRFELMMELTDSESLSPAKTLAVAALAKRINTVLPDVAEMADPVAAPVPRATLDTISKQRDQWLAAARDTPYESYVDDILRDVDARQQSHKRVQEAAQKFIGSPAPQLPSTRLDGKPLDPATLKGKTLVLHFWTYDKEPLTAPFGQVGSLDFLARKHAQEDVIALGVAVDPAFGDPAASGAAMRSSQHFVEFMNLGYTICRDDGTLLRKFGDPLSLAAKLPLWVVIDAKGEVQFYQTGLIEEKPGDGLKELDAAITIQQKQDDQGTAAGSGDG